MEYWINVFESAGEIINDLSACRDWYDAVDEVVNYPHLDYIHTIHQDGGKVEIINLSGAARDYAPRDVAGELADILRNDQKERELMGDAA